MIKVCKICKIVFNDENEKVCRKCVEDAIINVLSIITYFDYCKNIQAKIYFNNRLYEIVELQDIMHTLDKQPDAKEWYNFCNQIIEIIAFDKPYSEIVKNS